MTDLLHHPGFLGTSANFATDFTLTLSLLVALLFTIGAYLAKRAQGVERRYAKGDPERARAGRLFRQHRWVQTTAALLNVVLVLWMMLLPYRDFILPGVPGRLGQAFYGVTTLHAFIGFFAFVVGGFVVLRGNKLVPTRLAFRNYKPWMRSAYVLYMVTTLLGLWVYVTWFVTNPTPPVYK